MNDPNRRDALRTSAGAGLYAFAAPAADPKGDVRAQPVPKAPKKPGERDRKAVIAAGMTEAEADCWAMAAELGGKLFDLPELHPLDKQEIANEIHVIQHRLLSRPTYRKYLEMHKEQAGATE